LGVCILIGWWSKNFRHLPATAVIYAATVIDRARRSLRLSDAAGPALVRISKRTPFSDSFDSGLKPAGHGTD
jgi:hypothetical protein